MVFSRISPAQFATKTGCFDDEWSHWSLVVLSVHMKTSFIRMLSALIISSLRRVWNKAAGNSSLGIDVAFINATRVFAIKSFLLLASKSLLS